MQAKNYDSGYKKNLRNKKEYIHFLKKYIKADWTKDLKSEQLSLIDKEFVLYDYQKRQANIIWKIQLEDREIYMIIINELQSYVDYTMPFRILVYITNAWIQIFLNTEESERNQKDFKLPVIMPVVFYNGRRAWNVPTEFKYYQDGYDTFGNRGVNFEYYLVDLNEIETEYILETNTLLDNIFAVDKKLGIDDINEVLEMVQKRILALPEYEQGEFITWLEQILVKLHPDETQIKEIIKELKEGGRIVMTYRIEQEMEEIFRQREAKGEARTISIICKKINTGLTLEAISEWTDIELPYIEEIAKIYRKHPDYTSKEIAMLYLGNALQEA